MQNLPAHFRGSVSVLGLIFGLALPVAALAQEPIPVSAANPQIEAAGEGAPSSPDIVVTAQRREQRLQDVPVSVSVVSGPALERAGIRSLQDLGGHLPAVRIVEGPASDLLNIRGIGSGLNTGFEQSVATFVDGVYRGRGRAIRAALFDLDRVEVLKGPQTTFFGNNAIAGALNITTRKPGNEFDYNASALYAPADGEYALEAGVTLPVNESFSLRAAGRFSGIDGFVRNTLLNRDEARVREKLGRISARFEPSEAFRSDIRFDIGESHTRGAFPWEIVNCPPDPAYGAAAGTCAAYLGQSGGVVDDNLNYKAALLDSFFDYKFYEGAWTNALSIGDHSLSSITSYFHHEASQLLQLVPTSSRFSNGGGLLPTAQQERYRQFSQELRLQSPTGGTLEYMVGAYYSHGNLNAPLQIAFNLIPFGFIPVTAAVYTPGSSVGASVTFKQQDTTKSAFGSATIRPIDHLRVNLGLRYTIVDKEAHRTSDYGTIGAIPSADGFTPFPRATQLIFQRVIGGNLDEFADTDRTDKKLQPSIGIQYDLAPDIMSYATYTKGFKAGGFAATSQGEIFEPESVDSYEIGVKSSFFNRRLTVNIAAFQMDYKKLQESTFVFLPSGTILSVIGNAAEARSKGIELGTALRIAPGLSLTADLSYLDARYTNYAQGACTILQTAQTPAGQTCIQDMSGKRRPFAPEWSGNLGLDLKIPFDNVEFRLSPSVYFSSRFFQSASADSLLSQSGNAKIDLRAAIGPASGQWELAVIGKNITDKATASFRNPLSQSPGTLAVMPERPRAIAVQFSIRR